MSCIGMVGAVRIAGALRNWNVITSFLERRVGSIFLPTSEFCAPGAMTSSMVARIA